MVFKIFPNSIYLDSKLTTIKLISILLFALIFPETILAKSKVQNAINSEFGSYLAGRQAQFDSNPRFAIRYYLSALENSPKNMFLLRRIVTLLVSEGRIKEALTKANQLLKNSNNKFYIFIYFFSLYLWHFFY